MASEEPDVNRMTLTDLAISLGFLPGKTVKSKNRASISKNKQENIIEKDEVSITNVDEDVDINYNKNKIDVIENELNNASDFKIINNVSKQESNLNIHELSINKLEILLNRIKEIDYLKIDEEYQKDVLPFILKEKNKILEKSFLIYELIKDIESSESFKGYYYSNNYLEEILNKKQSNNILKPKKNIEVTDLHENEVNQEWFINTLLQLIEKSKNLESELKNIKDNKFLLNNLTKPVFDSNLNEININSKITEKNSKKIDILEKNKISEFKNKSQILLEKLDKLEKILESNKINTYQFLNEKEKKTTIIEAQSLKISSFSYPLRGIFTVGLTILIIGLLLFYPLNIPLNLQLLFGISFILTGGSIVLNSIVTLWRSNND